LGVTIPRGRDTKRRHQTIAGVRRTAPSIDGHHGCNDRLAVHDDSASAGYQFGRFPPYRKHHSRLLPSLWLGDLPRRRLARAALEPQKRAQARGCAPPGADRLEYNTATWLPGAFPHSLHRMAARRLMMGNLSTWLWAGYTRFEGRQHP
jgi:hypothetical protein